MPGVNDAKIRSRVRGRKVAKQLYELLDPDERDDLHLASALVEELSKLLPKQQPPPSPNEMTYNQLAATPMPFGKYEGFTLGHVPFRYLDWLCKENETFSKVLKTFLKHPNRPKDMEEL